MKRVLSLLALLSFVAACPHTAEADESPLSLVHLRSFPRTLPNLESRPSRLKAVPFAGCLIRLIDRS